MSVRDGLIVVVTLLLLGIFTKNGVLSLVLLATAGIIGAVVFNTYFKNKKKG